MAGDLQRHQLGRGHLECVDSGAGRSGDIFSQNFVHQAPEEEGHPTITQTKEKQNLAYYALEGDALARTSLAARHGRHCAFVCGWDGGEPELQPVYQYDDFAKLYFNYIADIANANFPLGLVPQKRPPQVPKSFLKCRENIAFWGLVGAFFGEPTQVEIYQSPRRRRQLPSTLRSTQIRSTMSRSSSRVGNRLHG